MAIMRQYVNDERQQEGVLGAPLANGREDHALMPMQRGFAVVLERAAHMVEDDKGAAAWLLDGLARSMVEQWYAAIGRQAPAPENLFGDLKQADERVAWRLRHALRAPDVDAKLIHCQDLYVLLFS